MAQFGYTVKYLYDKYLFQSAISCVKAWYVMCFRENNNGRSNQQMYITFMPRQGRNFTKTINVFRSENLALFTVARIYRIRNSKISRNFETRWKVTEDSRLQLQGSSRSKDRGIELMSKEVRRKRKEKVFNRRNWLILNVKVI